MSLRLVCYGHSQEEALNKIKAELVFRKLNPDDYIILVYQDSNRVPGPNDHTWLSCVYIGD